MARDFTDDELSRLSPSDLKRIRLARRNHLMTTNRITFEQWDDLVYEWNEELTSDQRRQRLSVCSRSGHDWTQAPIGAMICRRCCGYRTLDG